MQRNVHRRNWKRLTAIVLTAIGMAGTWAIPSMAADAEYSEGLVGTVKDDRALMKDDGITVKLDKATDTIKYDFKGKDIIFTVAEHDGIGTNTDADSKDYEFNNVADDGTYGTLHIYQKNSGRNDFSGVTGFSADNGNVTVNSNLDITATSAYASVGVSASNLANVVINGNVKMRKDDASSPWGIITKNVHGNVGPGGAVTMDNGYDANYTGARWNPTGFSIGYTGGTITVKGDVDLAVRGTAVRVDCYSPVADPSTKEIMDPYDAAVISLLGSSIKIDTPYREENTVEGFGTFVEPYYSLASYGGTINVNVKDGEVGNGKVEIVGNILAMKRSQYTFTNDVYQNGRINLALTTSDSSWKGIIDNANLCQDKVDMDEDGKPKSGKYDSSVTPFDADHSGEINLWLQNGAQWIYENASRKDGLDYKNMPEYSQPSYGSYDGKSHLTTLVGGKDADSAGIIKINDEDPIEIGTAEGTTKIWYDHEDGTPGTIKGGDVKVLAAKAGTTMMLYTGNNGITKGLSASDAAVDKNNVSEVLNALAHKLWYMAGDTNLSGTVNIAEGLTASGATLKTGDITFSTDSTGTKQAGQGFYDYTPEQDTKVYETGPITKSENIDETRESDVNGLVTIHVTEAQEGTLSGAPSALYASATAESPLVVDLQGHTLQLSTGGDAKKYLTTVYVDEGKTIQIKDSKGTGTLKISTGVADDGSADNKTNYTYGMYVAGNLTASTDVEIDGVKSTGSRSSGVYAYNGNVTFDKNLTVKNVQNGNKVGPNTAGIYADASTSASSPSNIIIKGQLAIENVAGAAIRSMNGSTISTSGATIKAMDMANGTTYSQYYAAFANKGTINLNTGDGITAGVLDVTGDLKVSNNDTSIINMNLTKDSQWTGAAINTSSSSYSSPAGQVNLTMADGSSWTHETGLSTESMKTTFAGSNISKLDGSGVIYQKSDAGITVYNYSGDSTVVYDHDASDPLSITGGDFTIKAATAGSKITLVTDSKGISAGFADSDTAAERNNVKEILNKLANKLFYTSYKDGNLSGTVKIADGLTASSVSATVKASGDITFSDGTNGTKTAGQGFYDYTPEQDKPNYKTGPITGSEDISLSRETDADGIAHVSGDTVSTDTKFISALYDGGSSSYSDPMTVKLGNKGLALSATTDSGQAAGIYVGNNANINITKSSADKALTITATNEDTRAAHGMYVMGNAKINISGPVEMSNITTKGDVAAGISIQGQKSDVTIDGSLKISDVKGVHERGAGINAAGISVTGDSSTVTVTGPVDISGVRGSGIKLVGADTKVSVGGGTITAAEDADKSHNFYAARVEKGQLDINMKDGAAGSTTTKITGDMYVTGQYGKKVIEYSGGELIDWKDAGVLNLALTDKDSFWKGVAAYDQYNSDYGTGGNTMHDIGQFNLYLQNGATWTNELQSHGTTTTVSSADWAGSTLATLHGGSDAGHAGVIYQKDDNPISVLNYSGYTTVFYDHDESDPTKIIGGDFKITKADEGSSIALVTDSKGISSGWKDSDSADAKDIVSKVLDSLAGKLFYSGYADGHLAGTVTIADGLTSSSVSLKTGDISFSNGVTGTGVEGQGFYDYKPRNPGSQIEKNFSNAITGDTDKDTLYAEKGVLKDDDTYVFTAEDTTIDLSEPYLIDMLYWGTKVSAAISGADGKQAVLDLKGNNLTVNSTSDTNTTGISAIGTGKVEINDAGAMNITAESTKGGQTGALFVNAGGTIAIHNKNVLTLRAKSTQPANAAVIKSMNGKSGVMSSITIDGLVDIVADKSDATSGANEAISAVASKVEIGGGTIKAINGASYAIRAYGEFASDNRATVNVNVKKDADGKIIGAGNNEVQMEGDVFLGGGMDNGGSKADVSVGLNTKDSYWKGNVGMENFANGSENGVFNLYMGNSATWTGNNISQNTVNASLTGGASWTGYSTDKYMNLTLNDGAIWNVTGDSQLASFDGKDGIIRMFNDSITTYDMDDATTAEGGNLSIGNYSGSTTVIYRHDDTDPTQISGGTVTIGSAATGSAITLMTDNKVLTAGFSTNDKAADQNLVSEVLNKLAQKLFYTANDGNLVGTVKIADGLTASSKTLKTGNISFSTDETGTKTAGQGFYDYTPADDSVLTAKITGGNDAKYVNLGIETEKGIYNFTDDATIAVTKGDYSSDLGAIESSSGPITINADGKKLDVSYTVSSGSNVARGVATGLSYYTGKDISITADTLNLSAKTTGFRAQGIYATGGKITINANTTISTSASTETNGIYAGSNGTVTMNGNLTIKEDTGASKYYALKADDNGTINVNVKDGKAADGVVKINSDIFTQSAESYDYWEEETTTTTSTINMALTGADSSWTGRSLYEKQSSGDDSTSYGNFNLWLEDGATWTNQKTGKDIPSGFAGSHVTSFSGNGGYIYQNDTHAITVDNYSGNTTVIYKHEIKDNADRAHASLFGDKEASILGGDFKITKAAEGSSITLVTDRAGLNLDSDVYTDKNLISDTLDKLANKLFYTGYADGHLKGYVKIAEGLTASSITQVVKSGDISYKDGGQGYYDYDLVYPNEQVKDPMNTVIDGSDASKDAYRDAGIYKDADDTYHFTENPATVESDGTSTSLIDAKDNDVNVVAKGTLKLVGKDSGVAIAAENDKTASITADTTITVKEGTGILADGGHVKLTGDTTIEAGTGMEAKAGGTITTTGKTDITVAEGKDAVKASGEDTTIDLKTGTLTGNISASDSGTITLTEATVIGNVKADDGTVEITKGSVNGGLSASAGGDITTDGTTITGDVHTSDGMIEMKDGSVTGNLISEGGLISTNGTTVDGDVHAGYVKMTNGKITGNLYAEGGTATTNGTIISGILSATEGGEITMTNGTATGITADEESAVEASLTGKDAALNGNIANEGDVTISLADGASWTGNATGNGTTTATVGKDSTWTGKSADANMALSLAGTWQNTGASQLASFTGSDGTLDMTGESGDISIGSYSGNTTVIFKHEILDNADRAHASVFGNKEASILGGDVKITSAAEGSSITLVTDRAGLNLTSNAYTDKNLVSDVLDKLANKLYYTGYADGHLTGYVKIAEGLTASSITQVVKSGDISYKENGQGYYDYDLIYPTEQVKDPMNTVIDGSDASKDAYRDAGIYKDEDDTYHFTENPATIGSDDKSTGLIEAKDKDINVVAKDTLKLVGKDGGVGILAENGKTSNTTGNTDITVKEGTGILADGGHVKLTGDTTINAGTGMEAKAGGTITTTGKTDITVAEGKDAVKASGKDTTIDLKTGTLTGNVSASDAGQISTDGASIKGNVYTESDGTVTIKAGTVNGDLISNGGTITANGTQLTGNVEANAGGTVEMTSGTITGDVQAAGDKANVTVTDTAISGTLQATKGGNITMTNGSATGITADAESKVNASLTGKDASLTGTIANEGDVTISLAEGASWTGDATGNGTTTATVGENSTWTGKSTDANMALTLAGTWQNTGDSKLASLTGKDGTLDMTGESGDISIGSYSGSMKAIYKHNESTPTEINGGKITINGAEDGASIDLVTDSKGLKLDGKKKVEKDTVSETLNQLAHQLIYKGEAGKLTGKVGIAEGLTSSSASLRAEDITFGTDGVGQYVYDPAESDIIVEYGSEETRMMQGTKSSLLGTTMMWRNNNNDLLRRMGDLRLNQGENGAWARYMGGKNKFDQQHTYLSQSYNVAQVGYDKQVSDWTIGVALDHGNGKNSFLGGKAKEKMTTFAVYGSKVSDDGSYIDIILKAGKVSNKFDVSNEVGNKLHSDYNTWGTSLSMEYGKRFVKDNGFYLDPSVELTMGRLNSKDYTGTSDLGLLHVKQHAFDSAIARLGLSIGKETPNSNLYAKLALAHEFGGAFKTDFFADDGGLKSTRIDLSDTWLDLELGGTYKLNGNTSLYGNFTRNFAADVTTKWRVDAGVRFTF